MTQTELEHRVIEFVHRYSGEPVDYDLMYGPQCFDLFQYYNQEVVGGSFVGGSGAKDIWNTYPKDLYEKIPNTPEGVPQAGDDYENIGRFAATLSAGAGYTWTVPTFTNKNLIQHPILETRWLLWLPTYTCGGSMTYSATSTGYYQISYRTLHWRLGAFGTTGGTASTYITFTVPFVMVHEGDYQGMGFGAIFDATDYVAYLIENAGTFTAIRVYKYNMANYGLGINRELRIKGFYLL